MKQKQNYALKRKKYITLDETEKKKYMETKIILQNQELQKEFKTVTEN